MTAVDLTCDVCMNESGGTFVGVASLSSGPMSVAFCNNCLREGAEPAFAMEYLFVFVAGGDLEKLRPEVHEGLATWADGRYMTLKEYVQRITPDEVKRQLNGYEQALRRTNIVKHENDGTFWFWDETQTEEIGPYDHEDEADTMMTLYAAYLSEGGPALGLLDWEARMC